MWKCPWTGRLPGIPSLFHRLEAFFHPCGFLSRDYADRLIKYIVQKVGYVYSQDNNGHQQDGACKNGPAINLPSSYSRRRAVKGHGGGVLDNTGEDDYQRDQDYTTGQYITA